MEKLELKGARFWGDELKKAGMFEELRHFNDVITEARPPHAGSGYGEPVITDVVLDDKKCDVYHSDHKDGDT